MEEEEKHLIEQARRLLTPKGETPFEIQITTANMHLENAMVALSHETHEKIIEAAQGGKHKNLMTPAQFAEIIRVWPSKEEAARLLGISLPTLYSYTKRGKGALKAIPKKTADRVIALRQEYNRANNITVDPLLDAILFRMGSV